MALPPQTDDAFLREVDEELRREQFGNIWRRYGRLILAGVVIALAVFGGYLWWQAEREKAAGADGEKMIAALEAIGQGRAVEGQKTLGELAGGKNEGYRAIAKLALAARKLEQGDSKGASADYASIAGDQNLAQPFRDLALLRGTAAEFDTMKPEIAIERLKPLAVPGNPWFGSASEMTAVAWLQRGRVDKAGALFGAIAKDPKVPESIRARATRLAGALGIDAEAAIAAPVKE